MPEYKPTYKPCLKCENSFPKPIVDEYQGRYSIRCPKCLAWRSEWVATVNEAIESWNTENDEEAWRKDIT